ncbi:MAG: hypothetical protein RLZZ385_1217 [Pseudomonadota bacterium]|jgi:hypothetical protein
MTSGDLQLPLVVAVTGHRDLVEQEIPLIRTRVKSLFEELKTRYPFNALTVMSPLAEGADMLVAEVAVEMSLPLIVPLPKPRAAYLQDFRDDGSRQRFQELCQQASDVFELAGMPPPPPAGVDYDKWRQDYPYAHLGTYLSAHCHILLAIWDGMPSSHLGGTAQVIKFHHDDVMPGVTPETVATQKMLVDDESDLVFHIQCSRSDSQTSAQNNNTSIMWSWFTKDADEPRTQTLPPQHELIFQRSGEFSADAIRHGETILRERVSLLDASSTVAMPRGIERINHLFGIADWLAVFYQRKTLRTLLVTHIVAFFMGLMFILYSDMQSWRSFLLAFLGFFGVAITVQWFAKRGNWKRKYLDYRTLAEGLRVQFYWAVAGITGENKWKFTHDSYLQSQNPEFGWIRNVMRVAGMGCDAEPNQDEAGISYVIESWVGAPDRGQLGYFKRKARDRIDRHQLTERIGQASLLINVMTVVLFIFWGQLLSDTASNLVKVFMGATLLLYAVREGYTYAVGTKELIKQYEFMLRIFDNAHRRLTEAASAAEQRMILYALGQSALDEHSDWILMHRERSLDESEIWRMGS